MSILRKAILQNQTFFKTLLNRQFLSSRTLTSSSSTEGHKKKTISVLFEEVVGLRPKPEPTVEEEEGNEVKTKLLDLELKIVQLKKSEPLNKKKKKNVVRAEQRSNIYKLFNGNEESGTKEVKSKEQEEEEVVRVYKELPLEMIAFVRLLHQHGYLNRANFITGDKLDLGSLDDEYSRTFVKSAAERFGKDYQEITK